MQLFDGLLLIGTSKWSVGHIMRARGLFADSPTWTCVSFSPNDESDELGSEPPTPAVPDVDVFLRDARRIHCVTSSLGRVVGRVDPLSRSLGALRASVDDLSRVTDAHSWTLVRCHSTLAELKEVSESLSASQADGANRLDCAECEFSRIDHDLQKEGFLLSEVTKRIDSAKQEANSQEAIRVRLRQHLSAEHGRLLNATAACSNELASISDLRDTADQLWSRSAALDGRRRELTEDCSREDQKSAEIEGTCSMLQNVLYAKRAIALKLSRFETCSAEVFEARAQLVKVDSELERQRQMNEGIEKQIGALLGDSSPLFLRNSEMASEMRALVDRQRELRDTKFEMVELQSKQRRSERDLIHRIEFAQSDLSKQRLRLDELKAKLVAVMEDRDRAVGRKMSAAAQKIRLLQAKVVARAGRRPQKQ
jgi:chromosome segregation ATPase